MQGFACVAVIVLMLVSCATFACANFTVLSVTASVTRSCISLFYLLIWCVILDESFLSVTKIITGHRCKMERHVLNENKCL